MDCKICDICFGNLAKRSVRCAILWMKLSGEASFTGGYVVFRNIHIKELALLEKECYVVSHQTNKHLIVRMEGMSYEEDEEIAYFCINEEHDEIDRCEEMFEM